ncbi:unknown protein [Waddlia chondrophila 2032/99]|uniref:Uncharacterized protein n=1 Tax=Waddlia chondrophila 2032/99 TaxID=765953 RepID=F8LDP4_9BACT|nr:unknown protein [Waddlia chondrophila 2032/99]
MKKNNLNIFDRVKEFIFSLFFSFFCLCFLVASFYNFLSGNTLECLCLLLFLLICMLKKWKDDIEIYLSTLQKNE